MAKANAEKQENIRKAKALWDAKQERKAKKRAEILARSAARTPEQVAKDKARYATKKVRRAKYA